MLVFSFCEKEKVDISSHFVVPLMYSLTKVRRRIFEIKDIRQTKLILLWRKNVIEEEETHTSKQTNNILKVCFVRSPCQKVFVCLCRRVIYDGDDIDERKERLEVEDTSSALHSI